MRKIYYQFLQNLVSSVMIFLVTVLGILSSTRRGEKEIKLNASVAIAPLQTVAYPKDLSRRNCSTIR